MTKKKEKGSIRKGDEAAVGLQAVSDISGPAQYLVAIKTAKMSHGNVNRIRAAVRVAIIIASNRNTVTSISDMLPC